jgi:DNA invertase Pin-like site-specific DNA recombinase
MGIIIVCEYIDRAVSGKTDTRTQFQKMLSDSARGRFGHVITWKIDRFSRNRYDSVMYKAKLKLNGVKVSYVADVIPEGPEGVIVESMLEGMAEYYSLNLATNVVRGLKDTALEGRFTGGPTPLGYKIVDGRYEVDETTAPIVRDLFMWRANNHTFKTITALVEEKYGKVMPHRSLSVIFRNKKYSGLLEYGKNWDETVVIPGGIPAIIDAETFARVSRMREAAKRAPNLGHGKSVYLLSGKTFCGRCGHTVFGCSSFVKGKNYQYYLCSNKYEDGCDLPRVRCELLDDAIMRATFNEVLTPEAMARIAHKAAEIQQKENDTEAGKDEKELRAVKKSIANIMNAIEAGIFTETTKARLEALENRQKVIVMEMHRKEVRTPLKLSEKEIIEYLRLFCDGDIDDPDFRRRITDMFIHKVVINGDDTVELFLNISDGGDSGFVVLTLTGARYLQTTNAEYRRK